VQEECREQGNRPPYYPRYKESVRIFTVFFAAVLGFGLKHLLDTTKVAQKPVGQIHLYKTWEIHTYKWLFFLVAIFIFLRFLTASANLLWLEYQRDERDYDWRDNFLVIAGFSWLTIFAYFGAYLCYSGTPSQFFSRAFYLLLAAFVASVIHVPWTLVKKQLKKWRTSTGQWALGWLFVNGIQLAVVVLLSGVPSWMWGSRLIVGGTWGTRLLVLAIASAVILIIDYIWQLWQLAKPPKQEPVANENEVILGPLSRRLPALVIVLALSAGLAAGRELFRR
jgi:hypothetical protein